MAGNTVKCNNCNVVINEVLAFIQNKAAIMDEDSMIRLCVTAFSKEEITLAKKLLFESVDTSTRKINRRKEGKSQRDVEDIIALIKETDPELLPVFVARYLHKLPPVTFDHLDATRLLRDLIKLQEDVEIIKEKYVTMDDLHSMKSSSNHRYRNINVNRRRGAYLLDNSFECDSGPIGLLTHNTSERSSNAVSDKCAKGVSETLNDTIINVSVVSPPPAPAQVIVDSSSNDECGEASTAVSTQAVVDVTETTTPKRALGRDGAMRPTAEPNIESSGGSERKLLVSDVLKKGGDWKNELPTDGWVKVQRKKLRNRFIGLKGKADNSPQCSFKAADNAPNQDPVYRKVAVVENFFDIIYTVHVELEGRPGKHAGQKRTYRTITETYAFLPREAVTRFLTGCAECARRPRSASPPPLPTPSPSPTRHPTYLPFLPHCAPDYTRNWESEIDAAHSNYYEPKFEYTELQPVKKVESPKPDVEDPEPTYIELTSKKLNGFEATPLLNRTSPVEPAFQEDEPVRTDPEIDKDDNSLIDVEDVIPDSPAPSRSQKDDDTRQSEGESTKRAESIGSNDKTEPKKEKKYNPLDVANLTSKDPPKSRSPPRKKLLTSSIDYNCSNSFGSGRIPKPWRPDGGAYYGGEEMDYNVPITTAYLKHMRSMAYQDRRDSENKDNLTPEPADMNDDDNFSSQALAKDAEKLKMMLLAWNYHSQAQGRNGDITESGGDSMADLWASYHSALGLGSKPPKPPTPLATGHSSPIHVGSVTSGVEPASTHDETSSSDRTKDDDDGGASDDDSDDRVDPQHHDPERLKAFNMFVRLFVDENLDRIVPISKQPKEKIQAIIDSCTRQFPEFAERARKRIRTYLKSCRRNKKVRGEIPTTGNGGSTPGSGNAWDTAVRPTPAHLTSVQAEHILAQACENESLNAKRMRLGLDPVSQPMPTVPTPMAIDTTATSAVASSFLSLYSGAISSPASTPATTTSTTSLATAGHSKAAADTTRPSASPTMDNPLLNNNNLKLDNANGNAGSKTASPASSPAPLFRPSFPNTFGTPQTFGRQNSNPNPASSALSSSALLSTLTALPPTGAGVNAAMAAYQSALLSAMAAHTHTFPTSLSAPTDLSLKSSTPTSLHGTPTASPLTASTVSSQPKPQLLSHKLSGAEVGAVRQLITGYRESAAFLLRSADELEALLLNQP